MSFCFSDACLRAWATGSWQQAVATDVTLCCPANLRCRSNEPKLRALVWVGPGPRVLLFASFLHELCSCAHTDIHTCTSALGHQHAWQVLRPVIILLSLFFYLESQYLLSKHQPCPLRDRVLPCD